MQDRPFYSQRKGKPSPLSLSDIKIAFGSIYEDFNKRGYFVELLGNSVISKDGLIGNSFETFCMRKLKKKIYPPNMNSLYSEDDLFDIIELLYEYINYPSKKETKDLLSSLYAGSFAPDPEKKGEAKKEYQKEINVFLHEYSIGWELTEDGYIRETIERDFKRLVDDTALYLESFHTHEQRQIIQIIISSQQQC